MNKPLLHLQKDPVLAEVIKKYGELETVKHLHDDLFTNLIDMIVSQQLSSKVATVIFSRLKNLLPTYPFVPTEILALDTEMMRQCGLSYAKVRYSKNIAEAVKQGSLDFTYLQAAGDEEVINHLVQIKGIGPWTAEMFLMFALDRPDVFSNGDLGLATAIRNLYGVERTDKAKIQVIAAKWHPFRTLACRYLWRSLDNV